MKAFGALMALVVISVLGLFAMRSFDDPRTTSAAPSRTSAPPRVITPSPTPDERPNVAKVVHAFIQALYVDAGRTGDGSAATALTVYNSTASGGAMISGVAALEGNATVTDNVTITIRSIDIHGASATAEVDFHGTAYDASWPALKRRGPDQTFHDHCSLVLEQFGDKWLVARDAFTSSP